MTQGPLQQKQTIIQIDDTIIQIGKDGRQQPLAARLTTTADVFVPLMQFDYPLAIPGSGLADGVYNIDAQVVAKHGADAATFLIAGACKVTAGVPALLYSNIYSSFKDAGLAAVDVRVVSVGAKMQVEVKGLLGTSMKWQGNGLVNAGSGI